MTLKIVGSTRHTGNATLCPVGIRLRTRLFGDNGNGMTAIGQIQGKTKPTNTTSDNDCVKMRRHSLKP